MTADEAVRDHKGLVWQQAKIAYHHGIGHRLGSVEDCVQVGFLGLMNAARLYDTSKGCFTTYATPAIRNAILVAAGKCLLVHIPAYMQREIWKNPTDCQMQRDARRALLTAIVEGDRLHTHLDREHWDGECDGDIEYVRRTMRTHLTPKVYRVFHARYFEGKPYAEIGREFGVSRQRIKDIHDNAIRRLRKILSGEPGHVGASPAYPAAGKTSIR